MLERVVDGGEDGVCAPPAAAPKVISGQVPDHCPAEALLEDEFRLDASRLWCIVPDPLVTLKEGRGNGISHVILDRRLCLL